MTDIASETSPSAADIMRRCLTIAGALAVLLAVHVQQHRSRHHIAHADRTAIVRQN